MVGCCRHQEKVIKLDTVMRMMAAKTPEEQLEANPKWQRLVTLHASLKKLLPEGHRCANCTASMCGVLFPREHGLGGPGQNGATCGGAL